MGSVLAVPKEGRVCAAVEAALVASWPRFLVGWGIAVGDLPGAEMLRRLDQSFLSYLCMEPSPAGL